MQAAQDIADLVGLAQQAFRVIHHDAGFAVLYPETGLLRVCCRDNIPFGSQRVLGIAIRSLFQQAAQILARNDLLHRYVCGEARGNVIIVVTRHYHAGNPHFLARNCRAGQVRVINMHPHIDILPLAIGGVIRPIGKRLPLVLGIENAAGHSHKASFQRLQCLVTEAIARQKLGRKHAQTGIDPLGILHRRELQSPVIIRQGPFQSSDIVA